MQAVDDILTEGQVYRIRHEFNNHPDTKVLIPSEAEWCALKTFTYGLKPMPRQCHGVAHYGPKWFAEKQGVRMTPYTGIALTSRIVGQFVHCGELKLVEANCKTKGYEGLKLPMYHRHSWLVSESGTV